MANETGSKKLFNIPWLAFLVVLPLAALVIGLLAFCVPFVAGLLAINMLFNRGKISFIKPSQKTVENVRKYTKVRVGFPDEK